MSNSSAAATEAAAPAPAPGDISLSHSRVYAYVGKVGLGHEHGVVGELSQGTLHLGAREHAGHLVFDMKSFIADTDDARRYVGLTGTTSASTRAQVNTNMLGAAVLNASQFPTATFEIDSATPMPPNRDKKPQYELQGKFTLHGKSRPLRITAEISEERNGYLHVRGGFVLRQSDYGITPFSKALGAIGVADDVKVYGDLWLRPEAPIANQPSTPGQIVR